MANNENKENNSNEEVRNGRGFASMDEEKQREIASRGGKAAHQKGTAHEFTSDEAKEAGRKGGQARQNNSSPGALEENTEAGIGGDLIDDFDR